MASIDDLMDDEFMGNFNVPIRVINIEYFYQISNKEKLTILLGFLEAFEREFKKIINPYQGSPEFNAMSFETVFGEPKEKIIQLDPESIILERFLEKQPWYVLDSFSGTDQERYLIDEIKNTIENLQNKYGEVFLLRNEEKYKIYDFKKGRGFQPDFILILKDRDLIGKYYQVFIEPKQEKYMENERWKEDFLIEITEMFAKMMY